ncbi:MAG: flagellar protein FlaG [Bacillota bacterium]
MQISQVDFTNPTGSPRQNRAPVTTHGREQNDLVGTRIKKTRLPGSKPEAIPGEKTSIDQRRPIDYLDEKETINAIEQANHAFEGVFTQFEFSIHEKTREIMVKVIDRESGEVIREIPPEQVLDLVAKLWELAGILVDERV